MEADTEKTPGLECQRAVLKKLLAYTRKIEIRNLKTAWESMVMAAFIVIFYYILRANVRFFVNFVLLIEERLRRLILRRGVQNTRANKAKTPPGFMPLVGKVRVHHDLVPTMTVDQLIEAQLVHMEEQEEEAVEVERPEEEILEMAEDEEFLEAVDSHEPISKTDEDTNFDIDDPDEPHRSNPIIDAIRAQALQEQINIYMNKEKEKDKALKKKNEKSSFYEFLRNVMGLTLEEEVPFFSRHSKFRKAIRVSDKCPTNKCRCTCRVPAKPKSRNFSSPAQIAQELEIEDFLVAKGVIKQEQIGRNLLVEF
ncbi:unnamed protein product [Caenorhabditis sp. 36 PRJEB53466]|nr:unnamed protein product [Caenorhabditis sp. 36 PRJEB53466]